MFEQKDVEKYQRIEASEELKNRIRKNVDMTQRRNKKVFVTFAAAAACVAVVVFSGNMYMLENHVVSVKGFPVLHESRTLDENTPYSLANIEKERDLRICVPMEVRVFDEAVITVSAGTLTTMEEDSMESDVQTETLRIQKPTDVYWNLDKEDAEYSLCTVQANGKEYVYELVYDDKTGSFTIRQLEQNEE